MFNKETMPYLKQGQLGNFDVPSSCCRSSNRKLIPNFSVQENCGRRAIKIPSDIIRNDSSEAAANAQFSNIIFCNGLNQDIQKTGEMHSDRKTVASVARSSSCDEIFVNYPFCASLNNSSNGCMPETCCNESAVLRTAVGDRQPEQTKSASQLFSQSNQSVCTEQPTSTVEKKMNQVEFAREKYRQQTVAKQFDHSTQSGFNSKECSANTGSIVKPAEEINCNFERFVNSGNQLSSDSNECLDQPCYSVNSPDMNNVSNCCVLQSPNIDPICPSKDLGFRRDFLCSVSSDPEVYAKAPSIAKLNLQIEKLRGDMLSLRSTTMSYKNYMEKIFDELKVIAIMHETPQSNLENTVVSEHAFNKEHDADKLKLCQQISPDNEFPKDCVEMERSNKSLEPCGDEKYTATPPISTLDAGVHHSTSLPSYQDALASRHSALKPPPLPQEHSPTRRGKMFERPNSDPFVSCSTGSEKIFAEAQHPDTSMPSKYSVKSANSSLENESKRARGKLEQMRMLTLLCKPNAALHISECSIDSGYQGSSETSPRDRQGREPVSQASPINEPPMSSATNLDAFHRTGYISHSAKQNDSADPCRNDSSKMNNCTENVQNASQNNIQHWPASSNASVDPTKTKHSQNSKDNLKLSQLPLVMKLNSIDEIRDDLDANGKTADCQNQNYSMHNTSKSPVVVRPIPKLRTVFATSPCRNETSFSTSSPKEYPNSSDKSTIILPVSENLPKSDTNNSGENLDYGHVKGEPISISKICPAKSESNRPQPPQCLTFIKPNTQSPVDTGSPLQSRVKLGVSAIKQLTPNNEKREELGFYCTPQMSNRANDANARMRKTTNTKQLLREKYAAVIERSANASKCKTEESNGESEWSMVRRRSMRMMTEFQIFDFKDGNVKRNSADKRRSKGKLQATQRPNTSKVASPSENKVYTAPTPSSSYSVSPSAASTSKEIFEEKSAVAKSKLLDSIHKSRIDFDQEPVYAGEPLPPPPPSPPKSSSNVDETPSVPCSLNTPECDMVSRLDSHEKDKEISNKHRVFLAPLIRPKASLAGTQINGKSTSTQKTNFNGLKLTPNCKSAFKPVANPSSVDDDQSPAHQSIPFSDANEPNRRLSLPQTSVSNKQRFLNEFMPGMAVEHNTDVSTNTEPVLDFHRHSSWRKPRRKIQSLDSIVSSQNEKVSSHKISDPKEACNDDATGFATTEPLFCELSKNDETSYQESKPRRHASCSKVKTSSVTSPNHQTSLESQPVRFDKSEKLTNVVGALRTAGYLRSSELSQSYSKASHMSSSSLGKNKKALKDDNSPAPAYTRGRTHHTTEIKGHIQTCYKARSSTSLHQYETVKLVDDNRLNPAGKHKSRKHTSKDVPPDENSKAPRSHKSTIALIRASLLGKRDKAPRSSTTDGKRDHAVGGQKVRSASVGDKLKINEGFVFESKPSKSKSKESKSKKNKTDSKIAQKEKGKKNSRETKDKSKLAETPTDEAFVFPDTNCVGYGNPDAEVMERFLAAAAAAASDTPRSPLQRLRSSFRTPKNKNRLLQESRIRDDMDVASKNYPSGFKLRSKSNVHNGQEFTYV